MNYKNIKQELDRLAIKYQKGGYTSEADKMAKERFNSAVNWEKEYLKGKKIKERILKLGLDPEAELERIGDRVNNVSLTVDNSDSNMNGAYYSDRDNTISYNQNDNRSMGSYAMNHETGHMFDRSNIRNSDMIDDRNGFVDPSFTGGLWQKIKSAFSSEYNAREGHEANWQEMVADVHAARQELKKSGYDGRFSNFTNQAYNDMRKYAEKKPDSASARLFFKVGAPETSRYRMLKAQYDQINPNEIPKEDQEFIKDYEKNKQKYDNIQKRYMFDIMNKVVSNEEPNKNIDFAKLGGILAKYQSGGKVNTKEIDKLAKTNFFKAIDFEKGYLNSNKIKERMIKSGLDPNEELPELRRLINMATIKEGPTNNGAHYRGSDNEVTYTNNSYSNVDPYTMSHEVGHIFGPVNEENEDFIDKRNTYADQTYLGRQMQKARRNFNGKWYSNEGHEATTGEVVADVHALRNELYPTGYDGRTSNFTNDAYNNMKKIAEKDPNSASAKMLRKIGTQQLKYYNSIMNKTMDQLTPEDEAFLERYQKDAKKHEDAQKRYIFDIMNKVVYNGTANTNINFAKLGGLIKLLKV